MPSLREYWKSETTYERFETIISLSLIAITSLVAVFSLFRLVTVLVASVWSGGGSISASDTQVIFGIVLTIIIALEFGRTLVESLTTPHVIMESKSVILIAILTVVRKLILLDVTETSAMTLVGLASIVVALGFL